MAGNAAPLVSVIIPTYNYSSVLRCAIQSALGQSFRDFELLVIGDGCTDDSEAVTASFGDPRIHWHNLPTNSGHQSAPNNAGLELARGRYIAYLGHDDLWMPNHLERLVQQIEQTGADVAYSLAIMIGPPGSPVRMLTGATKSGAYEPDALIPPSTVLHRADMVRDTGVWRDYRDLHAASDLDFLSVAWAAGKRFAPVRELTVLKFTGPWRKDIYKTKPSFEQEAYLARLGDPALLIGELTALALAVVEGNVRSPVEFPPPPAGAPAGWKIDQWREYKGLPRTDGERVRLPLYRDPGALRSHNQERDIVPPDGLGVLYSGNNLPEKGIFLGRGWHDLEGEGELFRWLNTDGELVLTNIPATKSTLVIDVESGPSRKCKPFELTITDEQGERLAAATISYRHSITLKLPKIATPSAILRLVVPNGGVGVPGDLRILNLRVFQIRWGAARLGWFGSRRK
jgi:glycosyltransferase involved in cell wall biosynthesis